MINPSSDMWPCSVFEKAPNTPFLLPFQKPFRTGLVFEASWNHSVAHSSAPVSMCRVIMWKGGEDVGRRVTSHWNCQNDWLQATTEDPKSKCFLHKAMISYYLESRNEWLQASINQQHKKVLQIQVLTICSFQSQDDWPNKCETRESANQFHTGLYVCLDREYTK